jgi:hypothetical protein
VASLLCRLGPPGAAQAGVEGDGIGVQVLVDEVEVVLPLARVAGVPVCPLG